MLFDRTQFINQFLPDPGAEDTIRLRTATVTQVHDDGRVSITFSGSPQEFPAARLSNSALTIGQPVAVLSGRGQLLVLGAVDNGEVRYAYVPDTSMLRFVSSDLSKEVLDLRNNIGSGNNPGLRSFATYNRTTGSSANLFITSDGNLSRSTSSGRFKTEVEDIEPDRFRAVLDLRPVWYRSTPETIDRTDWSWYGLVAEEVAEVDPRLVQWGHREGVEAAAEFEEGQIPDEDLVPINVAYDRVAVLSLAVIKQQQDKINALEQRVARLEQIVTDLQAS